MPSQPQHFRARQCTAPDCRLRFPVVEHSPLGELCPHCRAPTLFVDEAYATSGVPSSATRASGDVHLEVLLDNVRSLRNVGSMFRTADGAGVRHMHLGGVTPTPDHPKLAKTALGAEASVPWTHYPDAARAAADMVARGLCLWAVEGGHTSQSIFDPQVRIPVAGPPVVVVLGHEVSGIDPRIVRQCERVVHIPMQGIKGSLNVSVALGVVSYVLRFGSR